MSSSDAVVPSSAEPEKLSFQDTVTSISVCNSVVPASAENVESISTVAASAENVERVFTVPASAENVESIPTVPASAENDESVPTVPYDVVLSVSSLQASSLHLLSSSYYLKITVNGADMLSLLDSGCSHSCINSVKCEELLSSGVNIRPAVGKATCANGSSAEIVGLATISLTVSAQNGLKSWEGECVLIKDLPYDFVLGMNTLKDMRFIVDFGFDSISIPKADGDAHPLLIHADPVEISQKCSNSDSATPIANRLFVDKGKIRVAPDMVEMVEKFPRPQNVREVRSFLGFLGWFCSFISNFVVIAAPLTALLRQPEPFVWTYSHENSFRSLKQALILSSSLSCPVTDLPNEVPCYKESGPIK